MDNKTGRLYCCECGEVIQEAIEEMTPKKHPVGEEVDELLLDEEFDELSLPTEDDYDDFNLPAEDYYE